MATKQYCNTLAIAGIHSAGIAGLFTDLKTFAALGCNGLGVPTLTVTPDNEQKLVSTFFPTALIRDQLRMVTANYRIAALKLGLLTSAATIRMLSEELSQLNCKNVVLDLVICHHGGEQWLENAALEKLTSELIPLATLITPSLEEAEFLLNCKLISEEDVLAAARSLGFLRSRAVLIKGFKADGLVSDCLWIPRTKKVFWFKHQQLLVPKLVGAGCTLSSAITCFLAHGFDLVKAVALAEAYVQEAIVAGMDYGSQQPQGLDTLHHFYKGEE